MKGWKFLKRATETFLQYHGVQLEFGGENDVSGARFITDWFVDGMLNEHLFLPEAFYKYFPSFRQWPRNPQKGQEKVEVGCNPTTDNPHENSITENGDSATLNHNRWY